MSRWGMARLDGSGLEIQCPQRLWMDIRRLDGRVEPGFARLDGREITARDIGLFLLDWRALAWTRMGNSDLSSGQWMAQDGDYRINIYGDPGSSLWHEEVMDLYRRFMGEGV